VAADAAVPAERTRRRPPQRGRAGGRTRAKSLWLTDDEYALLEAKATDSGLSVSSYLRSCALGDSGPRARRRPPIEIEFLARANADLNRVGNNLNQIAHALNSNGNPAEAVIAVAASDLRETLAAMRQALGYDRQG
jgi:hypothetical protein